MAFAKVALSSSGIAEILQSTAMHRLVQEATETVAGAAEGSGVMVEGRPGDIDVPVEWDVITTDRAHGRVTLAHPSGQSAQAKHGLLTRAAAAAGLEVKGSANVNYKTRSGKVIRVSAAKAAAYAASRKS